MTWNVILSPPPHTQTPTRFLRTITCEPSSPTSPSPSRILTDGVEMSDSQFMTDLTWNLKVFRKKLNWPATLECEFDTPFSESHSTGTFYYTLYWCLPRVCFPCMRSECIYISQSQSFHLFFWTYFIYFSFYKNSMSFLLYGDT